MSNNETNQSIVHNKNQQQQLQNKNKKQPIFNNILPQSDKSFSIKDALYQLSNVTKSIGDRVLNMEHFSQNMIQNNIINQQNQHQTQINNQNNNNNINNQNNNTIQQNQEDQTQINNQNNNNNNINDIAQNNNNKYETIQQNQQDQTQINNQNNNNNNINSIAQENDNEYVSLQNDYNIYHYIKPHPPINNNNNNKYEIMIKSISTIEEKQLINYFLAYDIKIKKCKIIAEKKVNATQKAYITFNNSKAYYKSLSLYPSMFSIYPTHIDLNSIYGNQRNTQLMIAKQFKKIHAIENELNNISNLIGCGNNPYFLNISNELSIISNEIGCGSNSYNNNITNTIDKIHYNIIQLGNKIDDKITNKMLILADEMGLNVKKIADKMNKLDMKVEKDQLSTE